MVNTRAKETGKKIVISFVFAWTGSCDLDCTQFDKYFSMDHK